jgi:DNA ligase-1
MPVRDAILDGEAIVLGPEGKPRAFQTTMRRFGRRLDVDALRGELPLSVFWFDCLRLDGETLIDRSAADRARALEAVVPDAQRVPRIVTSDREAVETFWRSALARGHEGLMAKSLAAAYEAGGRGASWLKLKPAHTLDLVVLGAEWGSGRRRGWLSNLHLGARDAEHGGFVMLGKTFKGLTDETLAWQTERLLGLEIGRDEHTVYVRPEQVVEIAFSDVQASPHYPGGVALRFARVRRYRADKRADQADTIDSVRAILARQGG